MAGQGFEVGPYRWSQRPREANFELKETKVLALWLAGRAHLQRTELQRMWGRERACTGPLGWTRGALERGLLQFSASSSSGALGIGYVEQDALGISSKPRPGNMPSL